MISPSYKSNTRPYITGDNNGPFNQEMVRQNGTRNLAEIFTKIRYPRQSNENISRSLLEFLEQAEMMEHNATEVQ